MTLRPRVELGEVFERPAFFFPASCEYVLKELVVRKRGLCKDNHSVMECVTTCDDRDPCDFNHSPAVLLLSSVQYLYF